MDLAASYSILSDKELLNILSNDEKWTAEAQEAANKELLKRKWTAADIRQETNKRRKILERAAFRRTEQLEKNSKSGYSLGWAAFLVLTFPLSLLLIKNLLTDFARLEQYGFKKRIWQRVVLIILSVLFWGAIISAFN